MASEQVAKQKPKEVFVDIFIFDVKAERQIRKYQINLANHRKQVWLAKVMLWAVQNHNSVEIVNICDVN